MKYMGGKFRMRKAILETILSETSSRSRWVEPFCGAAWVTKIAAAHFNEVVASDTNEDVILYWKAIQSGWVPPVDVTREEHEKAKALIPPYDRPSALRAHILINCSFGAVWGDSWASSGTENRTRYASESSRADRRDAPLLDGVEFSARSYKEQTIRPGDVIYCDPPYIGTAGYKNETNPTGHFDHDEFWATMLEWAEVAEAVYVSEYTAPVNDCIQCVLEKNRTNSMGNLSINTRSVAVENLYRVHPRNYVPQPDTGHNNKC